MVTQAAAQESRTDTRPGIAPDIREDDTRLKYQKGDFVAVPIPMSNPTLDTGLIVGAAYFYGQTEQQAAAQPASLTGVGALVTSNESRALAIFQQNYWRNDRWRFTGAAGAADMRLSLISPEDVASGQSLDWRVRGAFLFARLSRRIRGDWYGGGLIRAIDTRQSIELGGEFETASFDTGAKLSSVGPGLTLEFDSRDLPTGPHVGRYMKAEIIFNDERLGSSQTYQSYDLGFASYHSAADNVVLAWQLTGCYRGGSVPLWDACRIPLRGFAAFDYLGNSSLSGQFEARWKFHKRWGVVAFGGHGTATDAFSDPGEDESTRSYGAGIRFEVLPAKRLNMRLDFARSDDDSGIYLSVGEAF